MTPRAPRLPRYHGHTPAHLARLRRALADDDDDDGRAAAALGEGGGRRFVVKTVPS